MIICPIVAVDKNGNRMGMGGGFHDTTLAKSYQSGAKKPLKVGWCYDFQVVEQLKPPSVGCAFRWFDYAKWLEVVLIDLIIKPLMTSLVPRMLSNIWDN